MLLAGSSLCSAGAWAQAAIEPEAPQASPADIEAAADDADTSDIVIVTARRREEDVQEVPIAVSVVSGETLERSGAYSLQQIQQLVPSLQVFSFNPRNTNINIRGLGSNVALTNDGLENGVGFYVDNVYYGRPGQTQFDLVDLAQVDVLRGPQGTLFGKNTTAGAINITTQAPAFSPEYFAEASAGDYGYVQGKLSATGPIVGDLIAYRLTASYTTRDGFVDNVRTGGEVQSYQNWSTRGQLLITPSDGLSIRLIADYSDQRQDCCVSLLAGVFTTYDNGAVIANNFTDRVARAGYTPLPFRPFDRRTDVDSHYQADMSAYGVSAEVNWDLGDVTLTSITANRWWDWYPSNDADGVGLPIITVGQQINHQRQFSEEIRLASDGEQTVDWVIGGYYFWQIVSGFASFGYGSAAANWNLPTVAPAVGNAALNGFTASARSTPLTRSYAAFGQATWNISDAFKLTGGLRYTREEKDGDFRQWQTGGPSFAGLTPQQAATAQALRDQFNPTQAYSAELQDDDLAGLVSASYAFTPDTLLYGSYSRGGKSGGLNLAQLPAGVPATVRPEAVESYELGWKSEFFGRALLFNAAVYETTITDYQTAIVEQVANTVTFRQYITNIPEVRSRGAEIDLVWTPIDDLHLSASAAYTDAKYVEYANAPQAPENLNLSGQQDLSGKPLSGVPKFTYTLSADYAHPVAIWSGPAEAYVRADWSDRTSFYTSASNSRYARVPGYGLLNLRIGLRAEGGKWDASIWARNLLDEDYFQTLGSANTGLITGLTGDPRTVGATIRTRF
jgi:iron complex outermembrane receptor protein